MKHLAVILHPGSAILACCILILFSCSKDEFMSKPEQPIAKSAASPPAVSVVTATYFESIFDTQGGGYTGGDGAYSIPLPDGSVLWTFGDSFLGTVNDDYSRPPTAMINNMFVIQNGSNLTTLHGGTAAAPEAYVVPPGNANHWYWPADGTVLGEKLYMFMLRLRSTGQGGVFGFEHIGTDLAVFNLPDLSLEGISTIQRSLTDLWGVSIYEGNDYIYVYGTVSSFGKEAIAMRFPPAHPEQRSYWTGSSWSNEYSALGRIKKANGENLGVSNMFSVIKVADSYVLITHEDFLGAEIRAYTASSPVGPWSNETVIYTTPETGNGLWTYNTFVHPHIQHPTNGMLLTYSVNSSDFNDLFEDVRNYRPRFKWLDIGGLLSS